MDELEQEIRAAFERGPEGAAAPPDLRQRVIANAVLTPRMRARTVRGLSLPSWQRLVPAIAAVLVVAMVTSLYISGRGNGVTPRRAPSPLAFGQLPAPGLRAPHGVGGGSGETPATVPYFGPAQLSWSGQLPKAPAAATVYAFKLAGRDQADALAARLGARPVANSQGGEYHGPGDYQLIVIFDAWPEPQPVYHLEQAPSAPVGQPLDSAQVRAAADAELNRLGLAPPWPSDVLVAAWGNPSNHWMQVLYQRRFNVGSSPVLLINALGESDGVSVIIDGGGRPIGIVGPLQVGGEETARYPLRSPADAARSAVGAPPLSSVGFSDGTVPRIALTRAELVYAIAPENSGQAYIEPAYLFSGSFMKGGITYEKRVLVPAVASSAIHS